MQRVEATFPSELVDEVMRALHRLRVPYQAWATEVRYADEKITHRYHYRGISYSVPWETRIHLEIVIADKELEAVIGLLARMLDIDRKRDDALVITKVDDAYRIGTARRGEIAFVS
jgi:nitrogen regulatory protein PII